MSGELNTLKDEVSESVSKFASTPSVKAAWDAAKGTLKIAGGALALGLLWKPALVIAFGAAAVGAYKGMTSYMDSGPSGPSGPSDSNGPEPGP